VRHDFGFSDDRPAAAVLAGGGAACSFSVRRGPIMRHRLHPYPSAFFAFAEANPAWARGQPINSVEGRQVTDFAVMDLVFGGIDR
jgi:hypothetical protein